jgi:transposase-like protein
VCLLRAISDIGATNSAAARWLGISETTLYTWLRLERPASVEKILDCAQLRDGFRRVLCTEEHAHPLGYVAKRRGSK